jgi:hypothetical protein
MGRHSPFFETAFEALPFLKMFHYPSKVAVGLAFATALLAGLGLDALGTRSTAGTKAKRAAASIAAVPLLVSLCVAAAALADPGVLGSWLEAGESVSRALLVAGSHAAVAGLSLVGLAAAGSTRWLAAAVVALDLVVGLHGLNRTLPAGRDTPSVLLQAIDRSVPRRIYVFPYDVTPAGRPLRRPVLDRAFDPADSDRLTPEARVEARTLAFSEYLYATTASRHGLATGYGVEALGLAPRFLADLTLLFKASEELPAFRRLLEVGAVDYVVALHDEGLEDLPLLGTYDVGFRRPARVRAVPTRRPRIYLVGGARVAQGLFAYQTLLAPDFDPSREIVLAEGTALAAPPGFSGEAEVLAYGADRTEVVTDSNAPGFLVMVDAFDPDWRATVDGRPVRALRANLGFRAVPVPAGRHRVELAYRPRIVVASLAVSAVAVVLSAVLAARSRAR